MEGLPGAVVEELFTPTAVVAMMADDGMLRLMMYCGQPDDYGTYPVLKSANLDPGHAAGVLTGLETQEAPCPS